MSEREIGNGGAREPSKFPSGYDLWTSWGLPSAVHEKLLDNEPAVAEQLIEQAMQEARQSLLAAGAKLEPTTKEMGVLARRYFHGAMNQEYFWIATDAGITSGDMNSNRFCYDRMRALAAAMGEEEFYAAIAEAREKWQEIFTEWEEEKRACPNSSQEGHVHSHCVPWDVREGF